MFCPVCYLIVCLEDPILHCDHNAREDRAGC